VISVGNLSAGGAGKTPLAQYIIRLLSDEYRCAFLSRGYGRRTRGLRLATAGDTPETLGDEPFQIWMHFGGSVPVAVCEDRAYAIPHLIQEYDAQVVVLDDAFQHRSVSPTLSILVTEYDRPFYNDHVLPSGRLREARSGARRADIVVVSKCPASLTDREKESIAKSIQNHAGRKPVFFASIKYLDIVWSEEPTKEGSVAVLVTGVANPAPLVQYLNSRFRVVSHFRFRDHHAYSAADMERILRFGAGLSKPFVLLTTAKDWGKLTVFREQLKGIPVGMVPIEYDFLTDGAEFDKRVRDAARLPA
jgi:tetraacyldisaccharide 4'-kinase